ncbi:MAG TPA: peptidoglycan editing factor PgeF [Saprospiraceae bacterium]|nr:peptidoglycan editing factor PgeF [Saprospiraceae bacterium]HPN68442.1 peptidoglycan editing factor PgeF [Saprospiraceae bacterium]
MDHPSIISPLIFKSFDRIVAAQSTRFGIYEKGLYPSFNLGESVGDDAQVVELNKTHFCNLLGHKLGQLAKSKQVHGHEVLKVDKPGRYEGYDALMSNVPQIILAVTIADCVPILLYCPEKDAIAAIHSGWKGTASNIIEKTVHAMQKAYGVSPKNIHAFIGACISHKNYEVGFEVASHFDQNFYSPSQNSEKFLLDLKGICRNQLINLGVYSHQIEVSEYCTVDNNELFYSHRFEKGNTGRMLAAIVLK